MKKLKLILATLFLPILVFAQNNGLQQLKESVEKILSYPAVKVSFRMIQNRETRKGEMVMSGLAFMIATETGDYETWFDGKTMWTWSDMTQEISMTEPSAEEIAEVNPFVIISDAAKNYNVSVVSDNNKDIQLKLVPEKKKGALVKSAVLTLNKSTKLPQSMEITLNDRQTITFEFLKIEAVKKMSAKEFRYKEEYHPGYDIIDLR